MIEQKTKAQVKQNTKTKSTRYTHPLSLLPHPVINQPPLTICKNNTMNIEFLVQMRQYDKCGSVRNDDIFNLHL